MKNRVQMIIDLLHKNDLTADFIFEAVQSQAKQVSLIPSENFNNPLRGGSKWNSVAKEILNKLNG